MKSFLTTTLSLTFIAVITFPTPVLAATSKTYTINSNAAANYNTTGITLNNTATPNWYSPEYSHRLTLTVNKELIGEELTDFPMLVRLTSEQSHLFNTIRGDGYDIVFTDDSQNKLSHEIETLDKNAKAANIWVKVPKLSSAKDTTFYLYYGNPSSSNNQNREEVWTNGYISVWHLNEDPAGATEDSTKNNNGTQSGGLNKEDSLKRGVVANAVNFDGSNDVITHGAAVSESSGTISHWLKPDQIRNMIPFYQKDEGGAGASGIYDGFGGATLEIHTGILSGVYEFTYVNTGGTINNFSSDAAAVANEWAHVVTTWGSEGVSIYVNGRRAYYTQDFSPGPDRPFTFGAIGGLTTSAHSRNWDGLIDEVQVSNIARSAAWLKAQYINQSDSEDFLSISSPTSPGTTSTSLITLKPTKALNYSSLTNFTPNGSTNITYQLSPNAGKTWYYYTKEGWQKTSANTLTKSSSANDINAHIKTLPDGTGKLLWRAILQPNSTLENIKIDYTAGTSTETTTKLTDNITTLYKLVFGVDPTAEQHSYWATRLTDKPTLPALFGAMQWQKLFSK